jgi:glycosyltransferase involved in cell wall biosynthesis
VALFAGPHDPKAFADRINQLAGDPALRAELAAKGQERAQRFSVAAQAGAMGELYRQLLSAGAVAGRA